MALMESHRFVQQAGDLASVAGIGCGRFLGDSGRFRQPVSGGGDLLLGRQLERRQAFQDFQAAVLGRRPGTRCQQDGGALDVRHPARLRQKLRCPVVSRRFEHLAEADELGGGRLGPPFDLESGLPSSSKPPNSL